jgi:hypothetical protein
MTRNAAKGRKKTTYKTLSSMCELCRPVKALKKAKEEGL